MGKITNISEDMIIKALNWSYDKAVNGVAGMDSAIELAQNYRSKNSTIDQSIDSLIRWQDAKAATSGFITGLGGIITLPVALPANITSVLYFQVRMIVAIAYLRGYDIRSDQVRAMVYVSMAGGASVDILKNTGIKIGMQMGKQTIKRLSVQTIREINKKVGFRLLTKFGQKGAVNLGKTIPLIGGFIGGAFDAASTHSIGKISKRVFS